MLVEIPFPRRCASPDAKAEFLETVITWGSEFLEDQNNWSKKSKLLRRIRLTANTQNIRFEMNNDVDGMALILAWAEN